ncbi:MAG: thioesterase family protein [Betaproteobacteria bacterium]|nr:thioesterase family protein [Betaproteobacteria bacterium]
MMSTVTASGGVRIFKPFISAGDLIGRLLLDIWRIPLSHKPSKTMPLAAALSANSLPIALSITVHYLRPGLANQPCRIDAMTLRSGRTLTTARATLTQDGASRLEVLAAFGDLGEGSEPTLALAPPVIPPPDQCTPRSGAAQGVDLPLLSRVEIRLHPDEAKAGSAGHAQMSGWIRFRDGRAPDTLAALLFADAFPPSVFGLLGMVGWVPTVELTVHVRRRPAPGWMLGQFRTHDLSDGRMIEDGALWDSQGQLVVQSRQLGLVRLADSKA